MGVFLFVCFTQLTCFNLFLDELILARLHLKTWKYNFLRFDFNMSKVIWKTNWNPNIEFVDKHICTVLNRVDFCWFFVRNWLSKGHFRIFVVETFNIFFCWNDDVLVMTIKKWAVKNTTSIFCLSFMQQSPTLLPTWDARLSTKLRSQ